jgi:uncharacterized protein with HEPN domain
LRQDFALHARLTFEQFVRDDKTFDAVVRNLTTVGEAVKHIPDEVWLRYLQVDWRKIGGLRDILVHEYFGIDEDILWDIVQHQVPALVELMERILAEDSENNLRP